MFIYKAAIHCIPYSQSSTALRHFADEATLVKEVQILKVFIDCHNKVVAAIDLEQDWRTDAPRYGEGAKSPLYA